MHTYVFSDDNEIAMKPKQWQHVQTLCVLYIYIYICVCVCVCVVCACVCAQNSSSLYSQEKETACNLV